jgi:GNAT superfamily N-acetyltransferase
MASNVEIKLIEPSGLSSIIPLVRQLNPSLTEAVLLARLEDMVRQSYHCVGLFLDGQLIAISGFWIITKFYVGRHIEPDNVFVMPEYRRQGYGQALVDWVYAYGREQGCIASELNCYLGNADGNGFWEQQGFTKIGYHYQKCLD